MLPLSSDLVRAVVKSLLGFVTKLNVASGGKQSADTADEAKRSADDGSDSDVRLINSRIRWQSHVQGLVCDFSFAEHKVF